MNKEMLNIIANLSAIIVPLVVGIILVRNILSNMEKRVAILETKMELFWNSIKSNVTQTLFDKAPKNPVSEERWQYLLKRFDSNTLAMEEAKELRSAFEEREKIAQKEKDSLTLLSIVLGLALLAVIIGKSKS